MKKNQVSSAGPAAFVPSGDRIGEAAKKLSDASYPFLKGIDWLSDLYIKPLPGASFTKSLKAVDKTIVMGNVMDGNLLKAAAEAHHKAFGSARRDVRSRLQGSRCGFGCAIALCPRPRSWTFATPRPGS